jgi:hypothetical protein
MQIVFLADEKLSIAFEYYYPKNFTERLEPIKGKALLRQGSFIIVW